MISMAGGLGFEPRLTESEFSETESDVRPSDQKIPLDHNDKACSHGAVDHVQAANKTNTAKLAAHKSRLASGGGSDVEAAGWSAFARHPDEPPPFARSDAYDDPQVGMANRVLRRCRINRQTGCWEWQDGVNAKGYGRVKFGGLLYLPHRVVAAAAGIIKGASEDDDRRLILHGCDNSRCCNPAHLSAGTQSQNMKDCVARGRWRNPRRAP